VAACLLGAALLAPIRAQAAPARRALLVGSAADSVLQRVADELGAAGYGVVLEAGQSSPKPADFATLAMQRDVSAIVDFQQDETGRDVVIYVTDGERRETTLRHLKPRLGTESESEWVLALRIVEVLNGSLLELEQGASRPAKADPAPTRPELETRPDSARDSSRPPFGLSLRGGARGLWLSGGIASFVGPELALRTRHRSGVFIDASAFVSVSSERLAAASGRADLRTFVADMGLGFSRSVARDLHWGAGLTVGLLGAWAVAEPEVGYRARAAHSLTTLVLLRTEAKYSISQAWSVYGSLGAGRIFPALDVSLASQPVGSAGPWLASGSAGLSLEWGLR
jgi:hypothetical protein